MKYSACCVVIFVVGIVNGIGPTVHVMAKETSRDIALRQAETKYQTALNTAEKRLQEAHAQFRKSASTARQQFITDLAAMRALPDPRPSSSSLPSKQKTKFKNLPVTVPGTTPTLLLEGGDSVWSEIPKIARGAIIFVPPGDVRKDGFVEFTVTRDALITVAASWAYGGNASGDWLKERKSKQQLVADGWIEIGSMYRGRTDRHRLFSQHCKKGQVFRIRTRKYREPYVMVTGYVKNPQQVELKRVDPKVVVEVPGSKVQPISEVVAPSQISDQLEGTLIYDSGTSGVAVVRVHRKSLIYVAASWKYDGNSSGQWTQERWTKEEFQENGWKEIGSIKVPHRGHEQQHILFVRQCNKGERFRLRSRKYGAPFVFVPNTQ